MQRGTRHIFLATLLAAVWIATPVLSAIHVALEAHTYCAEHGTLEEGTPHQLDSDTASNTEDSTDAGVHTNKEEDSDSSSHTVCAFGDPATRDIKAFDVAVLVGPAPATGACTLAVYENTVPANLRLLLLAPKTSPPLAA